MFRNVLCLHDGSRIELASCLDLERARRAAADLIQQLGKSGERLAPYWIELLNPAGGVVEARDPFGRKTTPAAATAVDTISVSKC